MGDLSLEERLRQTQKACRKLQDEFDNPRTRELITKILSDEE